MKVYLIYFSSECSHGSYLFAESLKFLEKCYVKATGYFSFSEEIREYERLKRENVKKVTLIIPATSIQFIEEISVE